MRTARKKVWRKKIYFLDDDGDDSVSGVNVFTQREYYFLLMDAHTRNEDKYHVYWEF